MKFMIDEAFLPATLTSPPMTDEQFAEFCAEHPELHFEMTATGEILIMPPTFFLTGARNNEISGQLRNWARVDGRGVATDSSTGSVLLRAKMQEYLDHGAELGWLIDAERQVVEIYRPGQAAEAHTGLDAIHGEGPVQGFVLDLKTVWDPVGPA